MIRNSGTALLLTIVCFGCKAKPQLDGEFAVSKLRKGMLEVEVVSTLGSPTRRKETTKDGVRITSMSYDCKNEILLMIGLRDGKVARFGAFQTGLSALAPE